MYNWFISILLIMSYVGLLVASTLLSSSSLSTYIHMLTLSLASLYKIVIDRGRGYIHCHKGSTGALVTFECEIVIVLFSLPNRREGFVLVVASQFRLALSWAIFSEAAVKERYRCAIRSGSLMHRCPCFFCSSITLLRARTHRDFFARAAFADFIQSPKQCSSSGSLNETFRIYRRLHFLVSWQTSCLISWISVGWYQ